MEPLRKLTRQGTEWQWGKEENETFEALMNQLANASMMAFYDKEAPTEVVTDASPVGLGGILVQEKQGRKEKSSCICKPKLKCTVHSASCTFRSEHS